MTFKECIALPIPSDSRFIVAEHVSALAAEYSSPSVEMNSMLSCIVYKKLTAVCLGHGSLFLIATRPVAAKPQNMYTYQTACVCPGHIMEELLDITSLHLTK